MTAKPSTEGERGNSPPPQIGAVQRQWFDVSPAPDIDVGQLGDLLDGSRRWETVAAEIPSTATFLLWFLTFWDCVVTVFLVSVERGSLGCSGHLCDLITLDRHPLLTLILAAGSLVWLGATSILTQGFTRGTTPVLVAVSASACLAALAVVGMVLLAFLAILILTLLALMVAAVAS